MLDIIKRNAKALLLLVLIAVAGLAQALGIDMGLDIEHYIVLLLADFGVWLVPNKDPIEGQNITSDG